MTTVLDHGFPYDVELFEESGPVLIERGQVQTLCAAVENGNPLFWDDAVAEALTGGPVAPLTMLSAWFRPHHWAPGAQEPLVPLALHFALKERLGLPESVVAANTLTFHDPVRPGDRLRTCQVLRSVSDFKRTQLGEGRFWVIEVRYRNQYDDLVGTDTYSMFSYRTPTGADRD